jgi:hypothetical protein
LCARSARPGTGAGTTNPGELTTAARSRVTFGGGESLQLPSGAVSPFRLSRNPLYLGLVALDIGIALLWPSFWAVVLVPAGILTLIWSAIVPEERYLRAKFAAEYEQYTLRVRRWL